MGLVATTWEPGLPLGPHLGILTALIRIIRVMTRLMLYMILVIKLEQTRFASLQPQKRPPSEALVLHNGQKTYETLTSQKN